MPDDPGLGHLAICLPLRDRNRIEDTRITFLPVGYDDGAAAFRRRWEEPLPLPHRDGA
jgi:hypothetical protein